MSVLRDFLLLLLVGYLVSVGFISQFEGYFSALQGHSLTTENRVTMKRGSTLTVA